MEISLTTYEDVSEFLNEEWNKFFGKRNVERKAKKYYFQAEDKDKIIGGAILEVKNEGAKLLDILVSISERD